MLSFGELGYMQSRIEFEVALSSRLCSKKKRVHEIIFPFAVFQVQFVSTLISVMVIHVKIMENVLQMLLEILVVTVALGGLEKLAIQTKMSAL